MGLDMYLYTNSKKVCQDTNDETDEWEGKFLIPNGIAIYWDDCQEINQFFVAQVQGGKDDGGLYEVDIADLLYFYENCKQKLTGWERSYTLLKLDKLMENLRPAEGWDSKVIHKDEPYWFVKFYYHSSY